MDAIYYNARNVKSRPQKATVTASRFIFDGLQNFSYIWPKFGEDPMTTVPLAEAKNNLSKLVDEAAAGHIITIAKHGRALARLVPVTKFSGPRIGALKGKLVIPADFDTPLPDDVLERFEGRA